MVVQGLSLHSFVISEKLKVIQLILSKWDMSHGLQPQAEEVLSISQCKTSEEVMNLEANLNDDIYRNSLVCVYETAL